jgi:transketolase
MVDIYLIPIAEFQRVRQAPLDPYTRLELIADMCRANTLAEVKRAGSGHLGSSFSSLDIVTWLYYQEMNTIEVGVDSPDRDVYFSSKGHDVPGLYAVLYSLGVLPEEKFMRLRRLGGTYGHPVVSLPGIEANSGSLGMGISKGKGMAFAKRLRGLQGRVFVMTGDGELQEGQIYEGLQTAVTQGINNLNVIVDHNKVQSDKLVREISDLGNLEAKFKAFGWFVMRCDGHDFRQLKAVFANFARVTDRPKIVICDTIKGRGVSFMEHPAALKLGNGLYRWHSGAPDDVSFEAGYAEITGRIQERLAQLGMAPLGLVEVPPEPKHASSPTREYVAEAFGQALVELGGQRRDLVVLDADLSSDCRLRGFEAAYPERFIENGIAEQDMVSMAGGLALHGLLPVVNSFASFLASRPNEQIYTNGSEKTKIIYVCHYSGLIPAGPGQSHQSLRDISLFGALPNFEILQPCNALESRQVLEYCVNTSENNCVIRLIIGPSPREVKLPQDYQLSFGRGAVLTEGKHAVLFAYGPVMLNEALVASELLAEQGFGLQVVNMPWLNRVDPAWLRQAVISFHAIFVLEDHAPVGGLGDCLLNALNDAGLTSGRSFVKFGVDDYPACGTPWEVLQAHGLDGASLAKRIKEHAEGA